MVEFIPFPKMARLSREIVITEKIDGTNASILVNEDGTILAGSRTRWITPEADNFGFARWVKENEDELRVGLGVGLHYGEWWGQRIQRGYGLKEKRFSLFNTSIWTAQTVPDCCYVVPILFKGIFAEQRIGDALSELKTMGSFAAPGFMQPEGIVIYHTAANMMFKKTIKDDESPKGVKNG